MNINKKVYVPTTEELEELKKILQKTNTYRNEKTLYEYLIAKKVELIVANGGLEFFSQNEKEDYDIVYGVTNFYKEDIWCTPFTSSPIAKKIILTDKIMDTEYGLDYLDRIDNKLCNDKEFVCQIVSKLKTILQKDPNYRFVYQNNKLLNDIFERKLSTNIIKSCIKNDISSLTGIEPTYMLEISDEFIFATHYSAEDYENLKNNKNFKESFKSYYLNKAIETYYHNYINNPITKTSELKEKNKKLIRFLNEHK